MDAQFSTKKIQSYYECHYNISRLVFILYHYSLRL